MTVKYRITKSFFTEAKITRDSQKLQTMIFFIRFYTFSICLITKIEVDSHIVLTYSHKKDDSYDK